jgi:N utilization substance protein A
VFFKIRRGFESNRKRRTTQLAGLLTGYELDVIREGDVATGEDDDVELTEFSDEIESLLKNLLKLV